MVFGPCALRMTWLWFADLSLKQVRRPVMPARSVRVRSRRQEFRVMKQLNYPLNKVESTWTMIRHREREGHYTVTLYLRYAARAY